MAIPPPLPNLNGSRYTNGNGLTPDLSSDVTISRSPVPAPAPKSPGLLNTFVAPFLGAFAAVFIIAGIAVVIHIVASARAKSASTPAQVTSTATTTAPTSVPIAAPAPPPKESDPLSKVSLWQLGSQPARSLQADETSDIGWWTSLFYLPRTSAVSDYLKAQGLDVASVVPVHFEDAKDVRTITYMVTAQAPAQLMRMQKAAWVSVDPDKLRFVHVLVLNEGLTPGTFWNTNNPTVAAEAGTKLHFAWRVHWDKTYDVVTTDRLPFADAVFTQQQVTDYRNQSNDALTLLQGDIDQVNVQVQADTQVRLAQVAPNPPKPELLSRSWGGDGSGEPTKSAERIGGGTVAGAAGGAAFGAAAGDAGMGAGIGAGVGLLGGLIYDGVSKSNDRHRYERHIDAVNDARMSAWRAQVRVLDKQRDQIRRDAGAEKDRALAELANRIAANGGHIDGTVAPISSSITTMPAALPVTPTNPIATTTETPAPAAKPVAITHKSTSTPMPASEVTAPPGLDAPMADPPASDHPTTDQPSGPIKQP